MILAWNRPSSLSRLLRSLEKADYTFKENNFKWKIQVEIRIDGEGGKKGKEVKKVANQWTPSFGNKVRQTLLGKKEKQYFSCRALSSRHIILDLLEAGAVHGLGEKMSFS